MDRTRLAAAARKRRYALDLDIEDVARKSGLHRNTITKIEHGRPVKPRSLGKLDRGLDWETGSAERILGGGDSVDLPSGGRRRMTRAEALDAIREALADQPAEEVERLVAHADALPDAELFETTARVVLEAYRNRQVPQSERDDE